MSLIPEGYPLRIIKNSNKEVIHQKFICVKCKQLLRNPYQGLCGHRYCKDCLTALENDNDTQLCPSCVEEGNSDDEGVLGPNKIFPDNAIKREMSSLQVVCIESACPWEGKYKDLEAHLSECDHVPIICNLCQRSISRNRMQGHVVSKCDTIDLEAFKCPFGCKDVISDQNGLEDHELENQSLHLRSILKEVKNLSSNINSLKDGIHNQIPQAGGSFRDQVGEPSRICNLEAGIVVLSKDLAFMCDKISDLERQQNKIDLELKKTQSLERVLLKYEASLNEMQTRIDYMEKTSYDGFLIWKITEFSKHKENATNGIITSIYSPSFYTSKMGYKICSRLYLNGDGLGKGTHISLFFVIMKGPYDVLLTWPFDVPVKFELMDLTGGKDGIVDTFRPDPSSSSFKKPTSSMNIASGCPTFLNLNDFELKKNKYVKEDAMYIKIDVNHHLINAEK